MVPAAFVPLAALPLTANGKVDRRALPAPDAGGRPGGRALAAPRTAVETSAGSASGPRCCGSSGSGVHDNFFELGGDSILCIQIVARARQAGCRSRRASSSSTRPWPRWPPRSRARPASAAAEQGPVTGAGAADADPAAVLRRRTRPEPHHFNQACCWSVARAARARRRWRGPWRRSLAHHDALRLRFRRDGRAAGGSGTPRPEGGRALRAVDLSALPEARGARGPERRGRPGQASLDLARGPSCAAPGFDLPARGAGPAAAGVHHLAVDGVSWRVLLEDLETACRQARRAARPSACPPRPPRSGAGPSGWPSTPRVACRWSRSSPAGCAMAAPDRAACRATTPRARTPAPSPTPRSVVVPSTPRRPGPCSRRCRAAYRTQINDVLLTALARALARLDRRAALRVDLEGHGREEISRRTSTSRAPSAGSPRVYPVRLEVEADGDPGRGAAGRQGAAPRRSRSGGSAMACCASCGARPRRRTARGAAAAARCPSTTWASSTRRPRGLAVRAGGGEPPARRAARAARRAPARRQRRRSLGGRLQARLDLQRRRLRRDDGRAAGRSVRRRPAGADRQLPRGRPAGRAAYAVRLPAGRPRPPRASRGCWRRGVGGRGPLPALAAPGGDALPQPSTRRARASTSSSSSARCAGALDAAAFEAAWRAAGRAPPDPAHLLPLARGPSRPAAGGARAGGGGARAGGLARRSRPPSSEARLAGAAARPTARAASTSRGRRSCAGRLIRTGEERAPAALDPPPRPARRLVVRRCWWASSSPAYAALRAGGAAPRLPARRPYRDYIAWLERQDAGGGRGATGGGRSPASATPTPLAVRSRGGRSGAGAARCGTARALPACRRSATGGPRRRGRGGTS